MPIYRNSEINQDCKLGIWFLSESLEEISELAERTRFDLSESGEIKNEQKRMQWLAARCLLRSMSDSATKISYDELGVPSLDNNVNVSFSHSHQMISVLLDEKKGVGIDIQHINQKIVRIRKKFCSEKELSLWRGNDMLEALHLIWCAKEAVYKKVNIPGLIFKEEMEMHPFDVDKKGELTCLLRQKEEIYLKYEILDDYTLVYTVN